MEYAFYRVDASTPAEIAGVLPPLLGKMQQANRSAFMVGTETVLQGISTSLWMNQPTSFWGHGWAMEEFADKQPLLLSEDIPSEIPNKADVLLKLATLTEELDIKTYKPFGKVCDMFPNTPDFLAPARARWRKVKQLAQEMDLQCTFYQQTGQGWQRAG